MADLQIAPPLLKAKLHIPHRRPDMAPRSLLIKQLNERIQRKLTLITAPAGYGKTNLASEWTHYLQSEDTSNNRITWLSLEEADSEPGAIAKSDIWQYREIYYGNRKDERALSLIGRFCPP